jgi:hypothetical protein
MSAEEKQDELKSFEAALAALMPRTDRLDRERLMFLAGQQSALAEHTLSITAGQSSSGTQSKRTWAWPAAFAGMSAVAAALFVLLIFKPSMSGVENIVRISAPQAAPEAAAQEMTDSSDNADRPRGYSKYFNLAFLSGMNNSKTNRAGSQYSNAALLRQILAKGVDSWQPMETGDIDGKSIITRPLTNRELMNQLIDQVGVGPS